MMMALKCLVKEKMRMWNTINMIARVAIADIMKSPVYPVLFNGPPCIFWPFEVNGLLKPFKEIHGTKKTTIEAEKVAMSH